MVRHQPANAWPRIRERVLKGRAFSAAFFDELAKRYDNFSFTTEIEVRHVVELYEYLVRRYQPSQDPRVDGFMSPRALISDLRDSLVRSLARRATTEAVAAL